MYKITLLNVGKQKPGAHKKLFNEYFKRLGLYSKMQLIEITESKFSDINDRDQILKTEMKKIKKTLPQDCLTIVLEAEGKQMDSHDFATSLQEWSENETRHLVFITGSPLGIHNDLKKEADILLSLSSLTFPHDLAQVMLTEQLYRAMTILHKKTYHY